MMLWDNWRTLHCATGVAPDATRILQRTTLKGDYSLGRVLHEGAVARGAIVDV
jgi:taurine dioxygenase